MEMSPFGIATSLMGRVGRGERNKPKAYSKIVTRDRVESNNTWREEGGGGESTMSRILLTTIVGSYHSKWQIWQLHASGHGGLLTRLGIENFKHRDLRKMMEYLP